MLCQHKMHNVRRRLPITAELAEFTNIDCGRHYFVTLGVNNTKMSEGYKKIKSDFGTLKIIFLSFNC